MRTLPTVTAAAALALAAPAHAVELADTVRGPGHWGLGLGGGTGVSGLSLKFFSSQATSLQLVVGEVGHATPDFDESLGVDLDVLIEMPALATAEDAFELGWELGAGAWLGISDNPWLGINGVLGLQFNLIPAPVDIVLEYRPNLRLSPDTDFDPVDFGGHVRIYFM